MHPVPGALAALTAVAALLAGTATAAYADVRSFHDADDDTTSPADIRSVRVDNSTAHPGRVAVTVRVDGFGPPPPSDPDRLDVFVDTRRADPGPEFRLLAVQDALLYRVEGWADDGSLVSTDCGYSAVRHRGPARWQVVLPRQCLGSPGAVRIAVRETTTHPHRDDWAAGRHRFLGWVTRR